MVYIQCIHAYTYTDIIIVVILTADVKNNYLTYKYLGEVWILRIIGRHIILSVVTTLELKLSNTFL